MLIILVCSLVWPLEYEVCKEEVRACYERQIEIEDETKINTLKLCIGDFKEGH